MQREKNIIGSLPDSLDIDHVPSSSNVVGQQMLWNDMFNPEEGRLESFMRLNHGGGGHSSIAQDHTGWILGESSSGIERNDLMQNHPKPEGYWSSSVLPVGSSSLINEASVLPPESVNMNWQYGSRHGSDALNLNSDDFQNAVEPYAYKASSSSDGVGSSSAALNPILVPSRTNDERAGCSSDGFRQSCKRKSIDGGVASSSVGSSSIIQSGANLWPHATAVSSQSSMDRSEGSSFNGDQPAGSQRSLRQRINSSGQEPYQNNVAPIGNFFMHPVGPDPYQLHGNHGMESIVGLHQNMHSIRWLEHARVPGRNVLDNLFPATNIPSRPASRNVAGRNARSPGSGGSSGTRVPALVRVPPSLSSRNSRRLTEYIRRSVVPSPVGEPSDLPNPLQMRLDHRSGNGIQIHHRSYSRSPSADRHGDNPYPLRAFNVASGERTPPAPEQMRNVYEMIRRRDALWFHVSSSALFDQSVFFGVAAIHDRHREMRLDVDSMSYEELLALEERMGDVSTGLNEETILQYLKQRKYSDSLRDEMKEEPCCVCQEEYCEGEDVATLNCGHSYHTDCIKQWLMLKNWCPICKKTGLLTPDAA